MLEKKHSHRTLVSILSLIGLSLLTYGFSQVFSFFHEQSDDLNKYLVGRHLLDGRQVELKWLEDDAELIGEMNPYLRAEITQSYADAWGILNLSLRHQEDLGLKENFTDKKTENIIYQLNDAKGIIRTDLKHRLKLHFVSYDKAVISLSDLGMISTIKSDESVSTPLSIDTADYKVVMTRDDGKWRINKLVRTR